MVYDVSYAENQLYSVSTSHQAGVQRLFLSLYFRVHYYETSNRGAFVEKETQDCVCSRAQRPQVPWMEHSGNLLGV